VPSTEQRGDVDQVGPREDADGGRADGFSQVARARVVADQQVDPLEHTDQPGQVQPAGQVDRAGPSHLVHERGVTAAAEQHHPGSAAGQHPAQSP
jgi:hypothetical protein